jgi:hypothetical protein
MNVPVGSTSVVGRPITAPLGSSTKGADVAVRSAQGLTTENNDLLGDKVRRGVAAALVGVTLLGSAQVAQAETLNVQTPQTTSFVAANPATGPPGFTVGHVASADSLAGQQRLTDFVNGTKKVSARVPVTADARTTAAFDTFNTRLTQILHHDAASLAAGFRPTQPGETISQAQLDQFNAAVKDLVKELPVSTLGDGPRAHLEKALRSVGSTVDLRDKRIGDLPSVASDAARALLKDFRAEHPTAFWTAATAVAGGAVAIGYANGTDALEKIGIKPQLRTNVFKTDSSRIDVGVGVKAGPKFSDPQTTFNIDGDHRFGSGTVVRGGLEARLRSNEFAGGRISVGTTTASGLNAAGEVNVDHNFQPIDTRLSVSTQYERWTLSGGAAYTFSDDRFSASIAAGRTFDINTKDDLDLQIRGSVDTRGESRIGVGLTYRW